MTDANSASDELRKIGHRVNDCAGLALGINLLVIDRRGFNEEQFESAIIGMTSALEEQLKRLAHEIEEWV